MYNKLRKIAAETPFLRAFLMLLRRVWRHRKSWPCVIADLRKTYRDLRFLREQNPASQNKTLLIFALDDESIYSIKLFGLMATALRLQGWRIHILFRNRAMVLGRFYFKAFGIHKFLYLEDIVLTPQEQVYCAQNAQAMLQQSLDIQAIKQWNFEGSWLGPQIIATLSRLRFEGMPDFKDPEVFKHLSTILPQTMEHTVRAKKCIATHPAQLALTIEANYSYFGPLVDMAIQRGTPVIQMIQPWKDDGLIFRRLTANTRREHPSTVAAASLDRMVAEPWTARHEQTLRQLINDRYSGKWFLQTRNQTSTRPYTRDDLCKAYALDPNKKIAVVFSHVLWDANLFYGNDLFKDYGEWFVETIKAACANDSLNWLIKIHPANVWKRAYENVKSEYAEVSLIKREIGQLPPHVKLIPANTDISTLSLFETIDYGVTVRGTSGMELVCFGKPCLTAGTGRYSDLGFTVDSTTREEYLAKLAKLEELPSMNAVQLTRAKWYNYIALILRPWTMKSAIASFNYLERSNHPLDHNLQLVAHSLEEIGRNGDLAAFAAWADGTEVDYLTGTAMETDNEIPMHKRPAS